MEILNLQLFLQNLIDNMESKIEDNRMVPRQRIDSDQYKIVFKDIEKLC